MSRFSQSASVQHLSLPKAQKKPGSTGAQSTRYRYRHQGGRRGWLVASRVQHAPGDSIDHELSTYIIDTAPGGRCVSDRHPVALREAEGVHAMGGPRREDLRHSTHREEPCRLLLHTNSECKLSSLFGSFSVMETKMLTSSPAFATQTPDTFQR